ncbi:MAG: hypothetical protein QOE60_2379, partial [Thermoleophilaceae bacterium]|nr:hypothetical protein [Thermoleophilaceae bacterium]
EGSSVPSQKEIENGRSGRALCNSVRMGSVLESKRRKYRKGVNSALARRATGA